jgi:SRSO17 transposase
VDALAERDELTYFLSVHEDTRCWTSQPRVREKQYTSRGETKTKTVLDKKQPRPVRVDELARQINPYEWYRFRVSEGTKGQIVYEFAKKRVVLSSHGLPGRRIWLIIKRTVSDDPEYSFSISNARNGTRLRTLAWLSGLPWAMEQCFAEAKSLVGMDDYEVRKFRAWHHHMLVCVLAHFFLWHLKIAMGKESTGYYGIAA